MVVLFYYLSFFLSFCSRRQFFSGAEALSLLATPPVVKVKPVSNIIVTNYGIMQRRVVNSFNVSLKRNL